MDDDVWDDDDNNETSQNISSKAFHRDLEKLQEIHSNEGYKAGIVAGQSQAAQVGFDKGYQEGARSALQFGELLGQVTGISKLRLSEEIQSEADRLVKEGHKLSEVAGKRENQEEIEEYIVKCKTLMQTVETLAMPSGSGQT